MAHEANREYCISIGDESQVPWSIAPAWQKESARNGVLAAKSGLSPVELHASWSAQKIAEGWVYGPVKDSEAKTHPCLVSYDELPEVQKVKDIIFRAVARAALRFSL
ncbi:hypothetical protein H8F01_00715 [Dyella telluris]|uniref:Ryanodine receptor Ryr domain-containing protein n=2 Tax=Dyella telluris TaxID=2763498 RepID=A0A7G8QA15_9GAMM|nr:hypothetical protein H8F01_00715 [Dyella telluris]